MSAAACALPGGRRPAGAWRRRLLAAAAGWAIGSAAAAGADPLADAAAELGALQAQVDAAAAQLAQTRDELAALHRAGDALDAGMQRIERRAEVPALGREFSRAVNEQRRHIAATSPTEGGAAVREEALEAASDAKLRVERQLAAWPAAEAEAARRVGEAGVAADAAAPMRRALADTLTGQHDALQRLDAVLGQTLQALQELIAAAADLARRSEAADAKLTQLLFWVPANPGRQVLTELPPALGWTLLPTHWRGTVAAVGAGWSARPAWPTLLLLAAVASLVARRRLLGRIAARSPRDAGAAGGQPRGTAAALAASAILPLPLPLAMVAAALAIGSAPEATPFALAVADALRGTARVVAALAGFAWLLDRRGLGVMRFGWDAGAHDRAARTIRRSGAVLVPLLFVAVLNSSESAPFANRESLGRLAFVLAMALLTAIFGTLLRRGGPLLRDLAARRPDSRALRWHWLWFGALLLQPIGAAVLAGTGYFIAAGYFFTRTLYSMLLVLGALVLYGLLAVWVRQRGGAAGPPPAAAAAIDLDEIGAQTRSLLDLLVTATLVVVMWLLWKDAVPALSVIGEHVLWTYDGGSEGKPATVPVTVEQLALALLVVALTAVAVRNAGALMDFALLRRLQVRPDANYAIKTVTRYALVAVGAAFALRMLGVGWDRVHWLLAALGVGLGFGLQEIVANFVSGLIVLAERPIRIGDVVTVGEITGTVSRIRARATSVLDFDNREVIIPNKAFVTEHVTNWTLSNPTTRLLVKVGVAYGSDVARVQQLLQQAARAPRGVLAEPPPTVSFVEFGDSALGFEIRVYVESIAQRLLVQHELHVAIERTLREAGIAIPFPQRDVHLVPAPAPGPATAG